jgi:hypothetical protein
MDDAGAGAECYEATETPAPSIDLVILRIPPVTAIR